MIQPLHAVAETQLYLSRAEKLMGEAERAAIVDLLAAHPEIGDIIPGSGGLGKLRAPLAGRGKRGGARIIYYVYDRTLPIYLLLAYAKNERDDLTAGQRAVLRRFVENIVVRKPA